MSKLELSRCYATILYEESAAEGWLGILEDLHIRIMVSPLHDRDVDKDGVLKKPHWHIMFLFASVKSRSQVKEITATLHSVGVEKVLDPLAYAAYLIHRNSPDKAQYSAEDVIAFNIDYLNFVADTQTASDLLKHILDFIESENLRSFAALIQYCRKYQEDWLRCIYSKPYFFALYLKSRKWTSAESAEIDATGRNYAALRDKKSSQEKMPKSEE